MKHTIQIEVKSPKSFSSERVRDLIEKLLDVGYADAVASTELDEESDGDEDAEDVLQLTIESVTVAK